MKWLCGGCTTTFINHPGRRNCPKCGAYSRFAPVSTSARTRTRDVVAEVVDGEVRFHEGVLGPVDGTAAGAVEGP